MSLSSDLPAPPRLTGAALAATVVVVAVAPGPAASRPDRAVQRGAEADGPDWAPRLAGVLSAGGEPLAGVDAVAAAVPGVGPDWVPAFAGFFCATPALAALAAAEAAAGA